MAITKRVTDYYERHFLFLELVLSIELAIIFMIALICHFTSEGLNEWLVQNSNTIYPLIVASSVTLLGFVMTGVAVLISFTESSKLDLFRKSKQFPTLFDIYFSTIKYLALCAILGILGIISNIFVIPIFGLIIWAIIIACLRIYRTLWVLENIILIVHKN